MYRRPSPLARGTRDQSGCTEVLHQVEYPTQLITFPTGEVIVVGTTDCVGTGTASNEQGAVIERWARGQQQGVVERLPIVGFTETSSVSVGAKSPNGIYVAGVLPGTQTPAVVHFDGAAWSLHVKDLPGVPWSFAFEKPSPDTEESGESLGTWFIANGELWRWGHPFDAPDRVPLPEGAKEPSAVWIEGGDVWLICDNGVYTSADMTSWKWPNPDSCTLELGAVPRHLERGGCGRGSREFRGPNSKELGSRDLEFEN